MSLSKKQLWLGLLLVALLAIVPSVGTLDAGLVSDDTAALGFVHREAPLADLASPQYDLRSFRFWRPLVTLSLDLQEAITGAAPAPLRLFNLLGHLASALLLVGIARRLGVTLVGAALVGALAAFFPYQGGTVTWIVGRVDSLMVPLVLGSLLALLSGRSLVAALLGLLALATKETAIVLPVLGLVLCWAQGNLADGEGEGEARGAHLRRLAPLTLALAVVFVLRRFAIGDWIGGYPGGLSAALDGGPIWTLAWDASRAAMVALGPLAAGLALVVLWVYGRGFRSGWSGESRRSALLLGATFLAAAVALAPVVTNLATGDVPLEHRRTLYLADCLAVLGLGALFLRPREERRSPRAAVAPALVLLVLLGLRGQAAWLDTHAWAAAGHEADRLAAAVHDSLDGVASSEVPVLSAAAPRTLEGTYDLPFGITVPFRAYVFHWGFADRFRAPFAEAPRPVWPWRPVFDFGQAGDEQSRRPTTVPRDNLRWPFGEAPRTVPLLQVSDPAGQQVEHLHLGPELAVGGGPVLVAEGSFPGARFEAILFTELGYGVGLHGGPKPTRGHRQGEDLPPATTPFGGPIALRDLMQLTPGGAGPDGPLGGAPLWRVLAQAADLGATEAWLELRAVDDARGQRDRCVGASPWIHVTWDPALRDVLLPWEGF